MPIRGIDGCIIPDDYMPQVTGPRRKHLHPDAKVTHRWADGSESTTTEGHEIPEDHPVWRDIGRMIADYRKKNGG